MIYASAGQPFETVANWDTGGLAGSISVAIYDGVGGTVLAPTQAGVTEIAPSVYAARLTAPSVAGQYTIVWKNASDRAADELLVT